MYISSFVNRTSLLHFRKRRFFLSFQILVRILKNTFNIQRVGFDKARAHRVLVVKRECLHKLRILRSFLVGKRIIARFGYLQHSGLRCFRELRAHAAFRQSNKHIIGLSENHARKFTMKSSLFLLKLSMLSKQLNDRLYKKKSSWHIRRARLRKGIFTLKHLVYSARLCRALNTLSGANNVLKDAIERQRKDGLRVRKLFVSVLAPSKQGSLIAGRSQLRFDRSNLDALFISETFWSHDDPRRSSMLRVMTSRKDILTSSVFRRLYSYNAKCLARQRSKDAATAHEHDRNMRVSLNWFRVYIFSRIRFLKRSKYLVKEKVKKRNLSILKYLRYNSKMRVIGRTFTLFGVLGKQLRMAC